MEQNQSWEDWKEELARKMAEYGWENKKAAKDYIQEDEATFLGWWNEGFTPTIVIELLTAEEVGCTGDCEGCECLDDYDLESHCNDEECGERDD